jgi:hypothetical protein
MRPVGTGGCPQQTEANITHRRSVIERRLQREAKSLRIPLDEKEEGMESIVTMVTPIGNRPLGPAWEIAVIKP